MNGFLRVTINKAIVRYEMITNKHKIVAKKILTIYLNYDKVISVLCNRTLPKTVGALCISIIAYRGRMI